MVMKTELATLTIEEAAKVLGIARQTAYDLAARGGLPGARRLGKRWIMCRKMLNAWLDGNRGD